MRIPRPVRAPQENPYFNKRVKRQAVRLAPLIAGITIPSLLVVATITAMLLPQLHVTTVDISGRERLSREEIEGVVTEEYRSRFLGLFSRRNYFLLRPAVIRQRLEALPDVAGATVTKDFPRVVRIQVYERQPAYTVLTNASRALTDEHGTIFEVSLGEGGGEPEVRFATTTIAVASASGTIAQVRTSSTRPQFPLGQLLSIIKKRSSTSTYTLYDTSRQELAVGERAVPELILGAFERAVGGLEKDGVRLLGAVYDRRVASELVVQSSAGWYVIFDPAFSVERAVENVTAVLREYKSKNALPQYIDVRYTDRVFVKP